jgi:hypothetical protein
MSPDYIKRRIRELQRDLEHLRADGRKQYFRDYYKMNRDKKLQAANERNRQSRQNAKRAATSL